MKYQQVQLIKASFVVAILAIGGISSIANAGGNQGGRHHRHTETCGHSYSVQYAGKIFIDGYSTRIRSDRPMLRQVARAFRNAGYDACVKNGRIIIDYGFSQPTVRWSTDRYKARFKWDHHDGELSITLSRYTRYDRGRRNRRNPARVARRSIGWGYCE